MRRKKNVVAGLLLTAMLATTACSQNTGRGALIGGAAGAGLGALTGGSIVGNAASGAVAGGAGGFLYDALGYGHHHHN